jgi:uncharacterized secreted protein with C-terminal beta-propeller domain
VPTSPPASPPPATGGGLSGVPVFYSNSPEAPSAPGANAGSGAGTDTTSGGQTSGTNTQEAGVDEADLVETDGQYIYSLEDDELIIASASPASAMSVVSRRAIDGTPLGLYRHGDRLTVLTGAPMFYGLPVDFAAGIAATDVIMPPWGRSEPKITVTVLDVSDAASPTVVETTKLDGMYDGSRLIGDQLYIVVRNDVWVPTPETIPNPDYDPDSLPKPGTDPVEGGTGGGTGAGGVVGVSATAAGVNGGLIAPWPSDPSNSPTIYESEASYRARLEAMSLSDLLPGFESTAGGSSRTGSLVAAPDAYVRDLGDLDVGQNLTSVALLNVGDSTGGPVATSTVAGYGGTVYASTDALYLAGPQWDSDGGETTRLFKFGLRADAVPLVATGQVAGTVLNQFCMDEEGDDFRIATNQWSFNPEDGTGGSASNLFVLQQTGNDLETVGSVRNLAHGERLQSARFVGDRAYVVTFRQVDPLFTIDLSDSAHPRVAGELKVPGFSTYLHPISEDLLLGLGRDIDPETQQDRGLQLSLFDVSDLSSPKRLATYKLSDDFANSEAEYDHHAFAYFSDKQIVAVPVTEYGGIVTDGDGLVVDGGYSQTLAVLRVDVAGKQFQSLGKETPPSGVRRSLRIDDVLYAVGTEHIQAVELEDPATVIKTLKTTAG